MLAYEEQVDSRGRELWIQGRRNNPRKLFCNALPRVCIGSPKIPKLGLTVLRDHPIGDNTRAGKVACLQIHQSWLPVFGADAWQEHGAITDRVNVGSTDSPNSTSHCAETSGFALLGVGND